MSKITGVDVLLKLGNSFQSITLSGGDGSDTYTLTFDGETTAPIVETTPATGLKAALESLSNIDVGDVAVTGTAGSDYLVEFKGQYLGQSVSLLISGNETDALVVSIDRDVFSPVELDAISADGNISASIGMDVLGDYACVIDGDDGGLTVYNVSDPSTITFEDNITVPGSNHAACKWDPSGNYIYISADGAFYVIDAINKAAIATLGTLTDVKLDTSKKIDVSADGNTVYVAASVYDGAVLVNTTTKNTPAILGDLTSVSMNNAVDVAVNSDETLLYVASRGSAGNLSIVDISTPATPVLLSTIVLSDARNVEYDGVRNILIASNTIEMMTYNIFGDTLTEMGTLTFDPAIGQINMALNGQLAFIPSSIGDGFYIMDYTNITSPAIISRTFDAVDLLTCNSAVVVGSVLYVSGSDYLRSFDWTVTSATLIKVAAQISLTLSYPTEAADCTNKDSDNWHEELLTIRNWTIEDSQYIVYDDSAYIALEKAFTSRTPLNVYVVLPGGSKRYGVANLTNLNAEFPHDGVITSPISLTGTGSLKRI